MKAKHLTTIGDLQTVLFKKVISAYSPVRANDTRNIRIKYEDDYFIFSSLKEYKGHVIILFHYEIPFTTQENYKNEHEWNNAVVRSVMYDIFKIDGTKKVRFKFGGITRNEFDYDKSTNTINVL